MADHDEYIPALGLRALTPLYDPLLHRILRDEQLKRTLIADADIRPGARVLDLGCGTGTLMAQIAQAQPQAVVTGADGDAAVLAIARSKVVARALPLSFSQALVSDLPYANGTFDHVLTSLVLHHLSSEAKRTALREAYRVLRDGGALHILDFGAPHTVVGRVLAPVLRHLEQVADNIDGLLPLMAREAGFVDVTVTREERVVGVATIATLRARKSPAGAA